jgi:hypothetical protein
MSTTKAPLTATVIVLGSLAWYPAPAAAKEPASGPYFGGFFERST